MEKCFFEFEVNNSIYFENMKRFFYALKEDKEGDSIECSDSKWLDFFVEEVLLKFWWPTDKELQEYAKLWDETPLETRFTDPQLIHPWDFESMIDAFANGEYDLISCEMISDNLGRIEFCPWSWPYGGSDVFRALIEYHGFKVLTEEV